MVTTPGVQNRRNCLKEHSLERSKALAFDTAGGAVDCPVPASRGCGMGLRSQHYPVITEQWPKVDWFEALSENYMDTGGRPLHILEKVRQHYPVALHGTALSIGSVDPLNKKYLTRLKDLILRIDPFIVSDHLCWAGTEGERLHDLLPLPFTEEALEHVVSRVGQVQEFLGRRILLENVSTYVTFRHSTMPEWEFLSEVSRRSGCGILLDLNNIYVNAVNHRFDPVDYLNGVPGERIGQIHLAGHTDQGDFLFDTHSRPVIDKVWALYDEALRRWGPISTLVEWDEDIPPFEELNAEVEKAREIYRRHEHVQKPAPSSVARLKTPAPVGRFHIPLSEAQNLFRSQIRHRGSNDRLENILNPQAGVSGTERLEVYAGGYGARIRESLVEVYEAVHAALGDESFDGVCRAYADRHVSNDYNLNHAGLGFAEFLKSCAVMKHAPFLADLAAFEWAIWETFHARQDFAPPRTPSDLAGIPAEDWERSVILFARPGFIFDSSWPVLDLWKTRRDSEASAGVLLENNPQSIFVTRKEDQVRCEILTPDQRRLVAGLLSGRTLGNVCEELAEVSDHEELPISAWFAAWMRDGLIVGFLLHEKAASH